MPSNPIQRKSRNSFFLGILVMLIIAIVVAGVLYITVFKKNQDENKEEVIAYVYALKQNVNSAQEITPDMVQEVKVSGITTAVDLIPAKTQDSEGNLKNSPMLYGYKAKIALSQGTILSYSMLTESEPIQDSERLVEYNMLTLPMDLDIGDYIDIRLQLANGQDLIVISKKEVKNLFGNTISLYLTEGEILMMNSAIIEAYIMPASNIHVIEYIEPGIQTATQLTYVPTVEVQQLINADPNITNEAKNSLQARFTEDVRTSLNNQTGQYTPENKLQNIEQGIQKQIDAAKKVPPLPANKQRRNIA